jgi:transposase
VRPSSLTRSLLGFARLHILSVRFEECDFVVEVSTRGRSRCSRCGRKCARYDRLKPRRWRDLDAFGRRVWLAAALWRVHCEKCGVVVESVSWADPGSGFTRRFEELVAWLAQRTDKTAVQKQMRIAWRTVGRIIDRVVTRHREPIDYSELRAISVDELSYRKGHRYLTLVTDVERGRIIWSKEGRSAATLMTFFRKIGFQGRAAIQHVAIDMSAAYHRAVRRCLRHAIIVFDRFHVQQLASKAVDEVRRDMWRRSRADDEEAARGIKNTRWALLKRPWNVTPKQGEVLSRLAQTNARLYRAYLLKEALAGIYDRLLLPGWARRRLKEWLDWAARSRLEPFVKLARTVRSHLQGILAYFETGYTTSVSEGLNNKARLATRQAFGFHSADAVRAMIELRCNKLDISLPYPS